MNDRNLSMLVDFYELTMCNGYLAKGQAQKTVYFDMFFRRVPDGGGYAVFAGLEQVIEYIKNLKFTDENIEFLRSKNIFSNEYLDFLRNFKFECDLWAVPEGTPVFPNEPLVTVRGPAIQAQFVETMLLMIINHQSLIATKARRIVRAAGEKTVMEYGTRRAQGADGAVLGARAAYIGGCDGTACAMAGAKYNIPVFGTMAHSWVQLFPTELKAFEAYAEVYPENCTLLVDTYNVLKSGVPNAVKVFERLAGKGYRPGGIRIDSGDIAYLSKKARKMLDDAGFPDCKIVVSNSLDEYIIRDLMIQGAEIDSFGVGERLITSRSEPVFGGVYKLVAVEENGELIPKMKFSENVSKITNPGYKRPVRLFDRESGMALADVILLHYEKIDQSEPYEIFDPEFIYKRKTLSNFAVKNLQIPVFEKGVCVYESPSIEKIREYSENQFALIWDEVKRFENPHKYYVDLSEKLWNLKHNLLKT